MRACVRSSGREDVRGRGVGGGSLPRNSTKLNQRQLRWMEILEKSIEYQSGAKNLCDIWAAVENRT